MVHCKAGKGRTGTMISCLLTFMQAFGNHRQAIRHYNIMRAKNEKALTIKSQMRYVKYFYGFLCLKVAEGKPLEKHQSFFELALKKHNYLSFNRIFEDMRSESIDMYSVCFGPFPYEFERFEIKISALQKNNTLDKIAVCDQDNMKDLMEWQKRENPYN